MEPLFSVSGLRGVVGESLTPEIVLRYTRAFSELLGEGEYLAGRDTRPHGPMIQSAVVSALMASGMDVIDLGVVPTPTVLYRMRQRKSKGGVVITASHNPIEWNALKFAREPGVFLFKAELEKLGALSKERLSWVSWERVGKLREDKDAIASHIGGVMSLPFVETSSIRKWHPKVVVDAVNGSMSEAMPRLLRELGAHVLCLHCEATAQFPHPPEPREENLGEIDLILKNGEAEVGFASDPDGDRLVFGLKGLGVLSEEYTLPVALREILETEKYDIVINLSTSMMTEKVADDFGVKLIRTPVGEANVVSEILRQANAIGGEGNGGLIFPQFNSTRDGLLSLTLILQAVSKRGIDGVLSDIPRYHRRKLRLPLGDLPPLERVVETFPNSEIDRRDGLYVRLKDSWFHLRPSNTEPITRLYIEAPSPRTLDDIEEKVRRILLF